jgi:hypothetical protein
MSHSEWNAELLRNEKLRELAAREAIDSDVIILATSEGSDLSPEIRGWLDAWRKERPYVPSALVALLQCADKESPHLVEKRLKAFANSVKMDFFCHSEVASPHEMELEFV